jgi:hypothetical protein
LPSRAARRQALEQQVAALDPIALARDIEQSLDTPWEMVDTDFWGIARQRCGFSAPRSGGDATVVDPVRSARRPAPAFCYHRAFSRAPGRSPR